MNEVNAEGAELSRLETALSQKEHALQALYYQVGKCILEIADGQQKAADALVDEIIEIRKQMTTLKRDIACPKCMTYNRDDSRYCRRCGASLWHLRKENHYESE